MQPPQGPPTPLPAPGPATALPTRKLILFFSPHAGPVWEDTLILFLNHLEQTIVTEIGVLVQNCRLLKGNFDDRQPSIKET
jgi:hypothetical protein